MKYVPPSIRETAFNCPHCGALTQQIWYAIRADHLGDHKAPTIFTTESLIPDFSDVENHETRSNLQKYYKKLQSGEVFRLSKTDHPYTFSIENIFLSECYHCHKATIWIHDRQVWPRMTTTFIPNADLPEDIKGDFIEAASIVDASPRGAAAILRLCIQKLCVVLGESGKNINADIAALVKKGLDVRVQRALDIVRVIGNSAVHPGELDLKDDRATAEKLFSLVNTVADIMITQPRSIEELYGDLPPGAKDAIARRDGKT